METSALNSSRIRIIQVALATLLLLLVAPAANAQDDPPPEAGRISWISGTVSIQPVGTQDWGQAYPNLTIGPGDRIFTDSDGRAEIQVGQTYVRIGPNTDVSLVDDTQFNINFGIAQGSIRLHSFGLWERQLLDVSTPNGNAEFERSGDLRVDVYPTDGATVFTNLGQFADITGADQYRQELDNGQSLQLSGSNPVYPQWLQPAPPDDLDAWSQQRDQQITRAASYQYVSPDIPGAADLDANGDWEPQTEYGAIWYPRNVPADWAPYHYGHWINHEPWGWVWVEDEPWGYAPFHYGRWVSNRGRWGWIPGPATVRPIYSPALVVFAGGVQFGGVGVSAWFPLGPGEAYRPWYHCSPRYIDQVNITNIRESSRVHVQKTYVNIVNVTNVTYINQSRGVTAMRQEDFASGRSGRNAAVRVDTRQMEHVQPIARPQLPPPTQQAIISRPVAHPVHVASQRPTVVNQQGQFIAARPGAQPVPPPARSAPPTKPLPGRTVVAAPARSASSGGRPANPGQGQPQMNGHQEGNPSQAAPVYPGGQQPRATPQPAQPGLRPIAPVDGRQNPGQYQQHQSNQSPTNNPGVQPRPNPQPPVQPGDRPLPPNVNRQDPGQYQQHQPNQPPTNNPVAQPRPNPQPPVQPGDRPLPPNVNRQDPGQYQQHQSNQAPTNNPGAQPRPNPQPPVQPGDRPLPPNVNRQDPGQNQQHQSNQPPTNNPGAQPRPNPQPPVQPSGRPNPPDHERMNGNQPQPNRPNSQPQQAPPPPVERQVHPAPPPSTRQEYGQPQQGKPNNHQEPQQNKNDNKQQKNDKEDKKPHE